MSSPTIFACALFPFLADALAGAFLLAGAVFFAGALPFPLFTSVTISSSSLRLIRLYSVLSVRGFGSYNHAPPCGNEHYASLYS
jgi:hypothetical protein